MKTRTRSQTKVLQLLQRLEPGVSAQELHSTLRQVGQNIGLATVYRALDALKLEGLVQVRTLTNGEAVYSPVQQDQHHLTCLNCDRSIPIAECPVHELEHKLQDSHQFKVFYHTLEFFGLCDQCQDG
ncbi:MAG: transcriptional repressor [Spirulina sp. SIO3F2]|nr:transcriptional repressor [Spirulina sp. SIO3F2]